MKTFVKDLSFLVRFGYVCDYLRLALDLEALGHQVAYPV